MKLQLVAVAFLLASVLAACSARKAEVANSADGQPTEKITRSPWQPPAEVDPPHRSPGDLVEPPAPTSQPRPPLLGAAPSSNTGASAGASDQGPGRLNR